MRQGRKTLLRSLPGLRHKIRQLEGWRVCWWLLTAQQLQHTLRQGIGLSQHGLTSLLQNLAACEGGSFCSKVGVTYTFAW